MTPPPDHGESLLLPEGTRLLHIGPQKTGTTAVQVAMHQNRATMREHGVVYPGKGTRPRDGVWAALGLDVPGIDHTPRIEHWHRLVDEVESAGDLRVCVSTEDFAKTDEAGAAKVVGELGGGRAHVVAVARRLDRLLPSQWQQRVKMRLSTLTYEEWLGIVLGDHPEDPVWSNIWVPHDVQGLVERWVKALGDPQRFTLVVADESDKMLLPRTFERMLGLPDGLLQGAGSGERNRSLGIGRIDAVRRLNLMFEHNDWPEVLASSDLHMRLTDTLRNGAPWPDEERIPALPPWAAERVSELSAQRAEAVRRLGVRVVGDPDDLLPPSSALTDSGDERPVMVSAELAARALEEALGGAADLLREREAEHRRELRRARKTSGGSPSDAAARPVNQTAARDLARELGRRVARKAGRVARRGR